MAERVYTDTYASEPADIDELFELVYRRPAWHADALCKEAPLSVSWFAETGRVAETAKAVCGRCLVLAECRSWALEQGSDLDGIFGGMDKQERAKLRREKRAA